MSVKLEYIGGRGVCVMSWYGWVYRFVSCVVVLFGEEGSRIGRMWLSGIVFLCVWWFVTWLVGWVVVCVCVRRGIGSCEIVYLAWGFSSCASSEDSGCCYLRGWRCGVITGSGAFGRRCGYGSCRFYLMNGSF